MNFQLIIKPSPEELAAAVGEWLVEAINGILRSRDRCSIALSGGTTPKRLYQWIGENELHCLDWSKVSLFWGDERNVPHDDPESNYRMVCEAWLDRAVATGEQRCMPRVYPVPYYPSAPELAAKEYSQTLRHAIASDVGLTADSVPSEFLPVLDIVLLGLGDDSHTASLFPETLALQETSEIFVANFVPKFSAQRLTMTAPLINAARSVAFVVCGASKQAAVDVVWRGPRQGDQYPAQLIHPTRGELLWFLDAAAVPESARSG